MKVILTLLTLQNRLQSCSAPLLCYTETKFLAKSQLSNAATGRHRSWASYQATLLLDVSKQRSPLLYRIVLSNFAIAAITLPPITVIPWVPSPAPTSRDPALSPVPIIWLCKVFSLSVPLVEKAEYSPYRCTRVATTVLSLFVYAGGGAQSCLWFYIIWNWMSDVRSQKNVAG